MGDKAQLIHLKAGVRLTVQNPNTESNSMFGYGIAMLCQGVRELGSLNAAAKSMGMAYSKAWRIIKDTEAALEIQLLDRDGAHGSSLTPEGNLLLDTYLDINKTLNNKAQQLYNDAINQEERPS